MVQRDAAWQIATEKRFFAKARNIADRFPILRDLVQYGHSPDCYISKNCPRLLADFTNDVASSQGVRFRANFDVGQSWTYYEAAQLSEAHQDLVTDVEVWCARWNHRIHHEYDTGSPLPPFSKLLQQNIRAISDDFRKLLYKDPDGRHELWDHIELGVRDRWSILKPRVP